MGSQGADLVSRIPEESAPEPEGFLASEPCEDETVL